MNDAKIKLNNTIQTGLWPRWIFAIFCVALSFSTLAASTLSYTFQRLSDHKIQIQLSFMGSETGETLLTLPNKWGEKKQLYQYITDLTVLSKSTVLKDTVHPSEKRVIHQPHQQITILNWSSKSTH